MAVTYIDILSFAKDCINRDDEVGYRNAISRAYYAAYHCVYPLIRYGPKGSHQGLINYLLQADSAKKESCNKKTLLALAYAMQNLKGMRVIADYSLNNENMNKVNASSSIITSEKLINKIKEITFINNL